MPKIHKPIHGAIYMILAGVAFAGVNALTPHIAQTFQLSSSWIAFYQYLIALVCMAPWLFKNGAKTLFKTDFFWRHFWRVMMAVIGVHFWVRALAIPIPIGQGLALLMVSPLFATLGAVFFLKENVNFKRSIALLTGFIGALIILNPWGEQFSYVMFFPLLAAFFWACHSIMLKNLSDKDSTITMVLYLYILITPFNLLLALSNNLTTFSNLKWQFLTMDSLGLFVLLGVLTALAQYFIAKAYSVADAVYVQPFDYFKLPLNLLLGFIFFGWGIDIYFIIGAGLIVLASVFISRNENKKSY